MGKILLFMMVSLDGYFEGENHDLSWHNVDAEFNNTHAIPMLESSSYLLFGRKTYELMQDYWPTRQARKEDPKVARLMNSLPKIVFSKTLKKVVESENWKNIKLMHSVNPQEINKIKAHSPKDLAILGSNNLSVSLLKENLIDELRIMVNPVVISKGTKLFESLNKRLNLKLTNSRQFKNGNILLCYQK